MNEFGRNVSETEGKNVATRIKVCCGICNMTKHYSVYRGITRISSVVACETCRHFYQKMKRSPSILECVASEKGSCFEETSSTPLMKCKACWAIRILECCPHPQSVYEIISKRLSEGCKRTIRGYPIEVEELAAEAFGSLELEIMQDGQWIVAPPTESCAEESKDYSHEEEELSDSDSADLYEQHIDELSESSKNLTVEESLEPEKLMEIESTVMDEHFIPTQESTVMDEHLIPMPESTVMDEHLIPTQEVAKLEASPKCLTSGMEETKRDDSEREHSPPVSKHVEAEEDKSTDPGTVAKHVEAMDRAVEDKSTDPGTVSKHVEAMDGAAEDKSTDLGTVSKHVEAMDGAAEDKSTDLGTVSKHVEAMDGAAEDKSTDPGTVSKHVDAMDGAAEDKVPDPGTVSKHVEVMDGDAEDKSTDPGTDAAEVEETISENKDATKSTLENVTSNHSIDSETEPTVTYKIATISSHSFEEMDLEEEAMVDDPAPMQDGIVTRRRRHKENGFEENPAIRRIERLQRTRKKVEYFSKPTVGRKMKGLVHGPNGAILKTGKDLCDCLQGDCPGCHFPCPKCRSPKCGNECRVNRKWYYERVDVEGTKISRSNIFIN